MRYRPNEVPREQRCHGIARPANERVAIEKAPKNRPTETYRNSSTTKTRDTYPADRRNESNRPRSLAATSRSLHKRKHLPIIRNCNLWGDRRLGQLSLPTEQGGSD